MSLLFNMLSRLVITFLPRGKRLLISWLQSPSAVILESPEIKSLTVWRSYKPGSCGWSFSRICCCCQITSVLSDPVRPRRREPTRLPCPWDSPGKNTGVGCHFLPQCMKVKNKSEVTQLYPTLSDPMDCSPPGSSVHGIFQARVLEWGAIAFSCIWVECKNNQFTAKEKNAIVPERRAAMRDRFCSLLHPALRWLRPFPQPCHTSCSS